MAFETLAVQDLRKGMYVKLECSWWKHPFASNKFKVTSQKEMQIIQGISKLKLFYDPALSDTVLPKEELPLETVIPDKREEPLLQSEDSLEVERKKEEIPSYLQGEREDRVIALQKRRTQLKQTERAFEDATRQAKAALRNISSGDGAGLRSAMELTSSLTKALSNDRTVMALLEVMTAAEDDDPLFLHSMNVCVLSLLIGKELGLSEEDLEWLGVGALAHDIGFLSIPRQLNLTTAGFAKEKVDPKLHIHHGLSAVNRIPHFSAPWHFDT